MAIQKRLLLEEKLSAMPTDEVLAPGDAYSRIYMGSIPVSVTK